MPAKKTAKKKTAKKAASRSISSANLKAIRTTVKADALAKTVGASVTRALAGQRFPGIRGPIICGIIFRPDTGTFETFFQER